MFLISSRVPAPGPDGVFMSADHESRCFRCGQPAGDPPRFNFLSNGSPCPTCRDRLLDSLRPALPGGGVGARRAAPAAVNAAAHSSAAAHTAQARNAAAAARGTNATDQKGGGAGRGTLTKCQLIFNLVESRGNPN